MKINCDLGEREQHWYQDQKLIPLIDQVNISCGAHAGSLELISKTLEFATNCGKEIGAHPGYDDRDNFGRVSLPISPEQLSSSLERQFDAFLNLCEKIGVKPSYVKPHGALYHDCQKAIVLQILKKTMTKKGLTVPIMIMSGSKTTFQDFQIWEEAFLDRAYIQDNVLMPRQEKGSVFETVTQGFDQYISIISKSELTTVKGKNFKVAADSLCVHGDSPIAMGLLEKINEYRLASSYKS